MTPKERAQQIRCSYALLDGADLITDAIEQAIIAAIEEDRESWVMGQNEYLLYFLKWLQLNKYKGEDSVCFVESFLNHFHDDHDVNGVA